MDCKMMLETLSMGQGFEYCENCPLVHKAEVLKSGAGYYVGVFDTTPVCRITPYMQKEQAEAALNIFKTFGSCEIKQVKYYENNTEI